MIGSAKKIKVSGIANGKNNISNKRKKDFNKAAKQQVLINKNQDNSSDESDSSIRDEMEMKAIESIKFKKNKTAIPVLQRSDLEDDDSEEDLDDEEEEVKPAKSIPNIVKQKHNSKQTTAKLVKDDSIEEDDDSDDEDEDDDIDEEVAFDDEEQEEATNDEVDDEEDEVDDEDDEDDDDEEDDDGQDDADEIKLKSKASGSGGDANTVSQIKSVKIKFRGTTLPTSKAQLLKKLKEGIDLEGATVQNDTLFGFLNFATSTTHAPVKRAQSFNKSSGGSTCYNCNEVGHMSFECPQKKKQGGGGGARSGMTCYNCNKEGHISKDCPSKSSGGSRNCFKCGEEGHLSRECPSGGGSGGKRGGGNRFGGRDFSARGGGRNGSRGGSRGGGFNKGNAGSKKKVFFDDD
ncbi:unnamed protein product [Gordionus sp. m RMFG-2023]|uniref:nucleolin-like isoform X2 n=1 Tax=Gordionus sp. m RMFG-2023 TaxID=3053472 RepID=UPI0030E04E1B